MSPQKSSRHRFVLGLASVHVIALTCAAAEVRYVDAGAAPLGNGTSWCTAFVNLQDALAASSAGDEIRVANGRYAPDRGTGQFLGNRSATFRLISGANLRGGYAGCGATDPNARDWVVYETVLDGDLLGDDLPAFANRADNAYHVVTNNVPDSTAVLDGFTVRGGYANGTLALKTDQGSGLHNHSGISPLFNSRPIVLNCLFRDNWAINHGAVNDHGGLTLINCEFRDNYAGMWGGGLYIHETLPTVVSDCRFYNNHTDGISGGGGGVVSEGSATFTDCLFSGNTSAQRGGGMYNHGQASPTLIRCSFVVNQALRGGGMYNADQSAPALTDCTFDSNIATAQFPEDRLGGAMFNAPGTIATLDGCTFLNSRAFFGAAMYNEGAVAVLTNCQFTLNRTPFGGELNAGGQMILPGGGAIYSTAASNVSLTGVVFDQNTANRYGGALYGDDNTTLHLSGCTFSSNHAYYGPVFMQGVQISVSDCVFRNGGGNYAGAMRLGASAVTIKGCLFVDNFVGDHCGGALDLTGSEAHVSNSMFLGNFAWERGGAICTNATTLTITNCVFSGNSTFGTGGAIFQSGNANGIMNVSISNCTFQGNVADPGPTFAVDGWPGSVGSNVIANNSIFRDGPNAFWDSQDAPFTLTIAHSNIEGGWPGTGNIDLPAMFVDADGADDVPGTEDDDLRLLSHSPCLDAGSAVVLPADEVDMDGDSDATEPIPFDLAGNPRVQNADVDMGAYEGTDCNGNNVVDSMDLGAGTSPDCNSNSMPDECDTVGGGSTDCNANAVLDECECLAVSAAAPDPSGYAKNRYFSFLSPNPCLRTAIRIKLVSLHHVDPPYSGGPSIPFTAYEGQVRWVGPPVPHVESSANPEVWNSAVLQCTPHFMDWSTVDWIHVTGTEIVPNSVYEVAVLAQGCDEMVEAGYSSPLTLPTARWGDVVEPFMPPSLALQPDFADVGALVDKFRSTPGAPRKFQALLAGNPPNPGSDLGFEHISACVDAFRGRSYPYSIAPCP